VQDALPLTDVSQIAQDCLPLCGCLTAELVQPAIADLTEAFLPSAKAAIQTEYAYQELKKMELAAASPASPANVPVRPDTTNSGDVMKLPPANAQAKMTTSPDQEFFKAEAEAMARFRCVHANRLGRSCAGGFRSAWASPLAGQSLPMSI
jgi:hypothetical protein